MTAYPPKAMAAVCIVMEAERKTYRKMVSHLRNNRDTVVKIGLRKIPSKSTIARAYSLIPDRYLAEVHRRVICEISAGSVAGGSTGYSDSSFVRWYVVRTDSVKTKRGWVKLHSIIDIQTRVVLDYLVTASNVADIIGLRIMLARFEGGMGFACFFQVCAVLPHQVCAGGSVFFRRQLLKAGLSEPTWHTRPILDPSPRSDLHRSTLGYLHQYMQTVRFLGN